LRTTGQANSTARFYFHKKLFPFLGISLYFFKKLRFGGSIPPVRFWWGSLVLPLASNFYTYFSFTVSPYSFLGRLFFVKEKER
jgi:hypothetical protein